MNRFGVDIYNEKDALIELGVLLSTINSSANPFIYIMLMPVYKRNFLSTFCECRLFHNGEAIQESTSSGSRQGAVPMSTSNESRPVESQLSSIRTEMGDRVADQTLP